MHEQGFGVRDRFGDRRVASPQGGPECIICEFDVGMAGDGAILDGQGDLALSPSQNQFAVAHGYRATREALVRIRGGVLHA